MNIPKITVYTISPGAPGTENYDPARFIVKESGNQVEIDTWAPSLGWWSNRPDMDPEKLEAHLENMKKDGFRVEEIRI